MNLELPVPSRELHLAEATELQRQLTRSLVLKDEFLPEFRFVAGADAAFLGDAPVQCLGGIVVWDRLENRVVEEAWAKRVTRFPCIPGYLSFREMPALLDAYEKLTCEPELIFCDGQGIAHPRRFGIACHLGVVLEKPSIGVAKSILVGKHDEVPDVRGGSRVLHHRAEPIGWAYRSRIGVRPIFLSPGHKVSLDSCPSVVGSCLRGYRLPEPTRLADRLVSRIKKEQIAT